MIRIKLNYFPFILFLYLSSYLASAQTEKDQLLKRDISSVVEELEFMYGYDQSLRKYVLFQSFDSSRIKEIEALPDSLQLDYISGDKSISESLSKHIFKNYINPKDSLHTKRLLELIETYGFPSVKRLETYYQKAFKHEQFNPLVILLHSPKTYWEQVKNLMLTEYREKRISQCMYGYVLWHVSGRKSFKPMLDHGYVMETKNGKPHFKSTCN